MSMMDYTMELEVECPNNNANDATFVCATATIGGRDTVEEFLTCGMYPLASSFSFKDTTICTTAISKVITRCCSFPWRWFLWRMLDVS
jgi:hypothetical protein